MAHLIYPPESLHLGYARKLHSSPAKGAPKLHLDRCSMLERRKIYWVSRYNAYAIGAWLIWRRICLTALWPSYQNIPNTFGPSMPTTTVEFTGFVIFWFISLPMIFVRPENFKRFFQFTTAICGIAMLCLSMSLLTRKHSDVGTDAASQ